MEGVGAEAASLAGHLKLSNLCWIYDDNKITIEGSTNLAFSENVAERFAGYGWNVLKVDDINDLAAFRAALASFRKTKDRPTMIIVRSVIAWGAPNKHGTHGAHGSPLGEEEIRLTKRAYGWPEDQKFLVPDEVLAHFRANLGVRGQALRQAWDASYAQYAAQFPEQARELELIRRRELPQGWDAGIKPFAADAKGLATRASSGKVLNQIAGRLPWLVGGAGDLAPSTLTLMDGGDLEAASYGGRNMHFGIREHAMGAIVNGMSLCGLRSFGSTFFVFTDYMRPSIRMAAIMGLPVFYVFTHDSIGVGEDGPTHQPVEHLAALRAIPDLTVIRPGDANEVAEAYRSALSNSRGPTALVLSRQNVPTLDRGKYAPADGAARRLRPGRRALRQAGGDSDRHRQRAFALRRGLREARVGGRAGPRGEPAELGAIRRPAARLSRLRLAAGRHAAGGGRTGHRAGLVQVHRPLRAVPGHQSLRRVGPGGRAPEALRLHGRESCEAGEGSGGVGAERWGLRYE